MLVAWWHLNPKRVTEPTCKQQVLAIPLHFNSQILNNRGKPFNLSGWLDGENGWYTINELWNHSTRNRYTVQEAQGWLSIGQARQVPTVIEALPLTWRHLVEHNISSPQVGEWVVCNSDTDDQPIGLVTHVTLSELKVHVHTWSQLNELVKPTEHHEWWSVTGDLVKMYVQAYVPPKSAVNNHTATHDNTTMLVVRGKMSEFPTMPECYGWKAATRTKTIMQYTVRYGRQLTQKHSLDVPTCQPRWEQRHPHLSFKWADIWTNIWHPSVPNKLSAHLWKCLHMLGREDFMCKPAECMSCTHNGSRGLLLCGGTHATWQCPYTRRVWNWLSRLWLTMTGERIVMRNSVTLYTGLADTAFPLQWRLLFQTTHYHIWLAWCKWAHEQAKYSPISIQATITAHLRDHLAALHHNAVAEVDKGEASRLFCQLWCQPQCKICDIVTNQIIMAGKW